jgi:hypothetical protein
VLGSLALKRIEHVPLTECQIFQSKVTQRLNSRLAELILKLYYCKWLDVYVTIPGASLFRVAADYALEAVDR